MINMQPRFYSRLVRLLDSPQLPSPRGEGVATNWDVFQLSFPEILRNKINNNKKSQTSWRYPHQSCNFPEM